MSERKGKHDYQRNETFSKCGKEKVGRVVVEHMESEGMINKFFDSREQAASYVTALKTNAIVRDANLEDVFIELTGRRVND